MSAGPSLDDSGGNVAVVLLVSGLGLELLVIAACQIALRRAGAAGPGLGRQC